MFSPEEEYDPWPDIASTLRATDAADDMGIQVLFTHGDEHFAHCPLPSHPGADSNPSFSFNEEKLLGNCFVCGGGDFLWLAREILELSREMALDWLIAYSDYNAADDGTFLKQIDRIVSTKKTGIRTWRPPALPWYPKTRCDEWHQLGIQNRADWFAGRRIDPEVRDFLKLGWTPEHTRRGYTGSAILIPHLVGGDVVGYQERWEFDPMPKDLGKYTNTPDFPRDFTLYNQDFAQRDRPQIVVESPMTTARLLSAGLSSMATFGAKVTEQQIRILRGFDTLWIAFDNDRAGRKATKLLIEGLDDHVNLEIVPPPTFMEKADLGDCDDDQLSHQLAMRIPSILHRSGL